MSNPHKDLPQTTQDETPIFGETSSPIAQSLDFSFRRFISEALARRARSPFRLNTLTAGRGYQDQGRTYCESSTPQELDNLIPVVLPLERHSDSFVALQRWEGCVTDVSISGFGARLTDLETGDKEDAFIPGTVVSRDDWPLIEPGAVFYWSLGHHRDRTERVQTVSELRFRRLPAPTEAEFTRAATEAHALSKTLGFITDNTRPTGTI